jgi:multiple sugar transport system permease protein
MVNDKRQITNWGDREAVAAWIFLAPALILLGIFLFYPIAYLVYLSFTSGSFTVAGIRWIGTRNYLRLAVDPDFWQVIGNTIYFTAATVLPSLAIPLGLAVLLNRAIPLRDLLRTAYFIPSITSLVAAGLGFRWLFQTEGPVNEALMALGVSPIPWLSSTVWAMPVLILLSIWKQLGFNLVVFLAGFLAGFLMHRRRDAGSRRCGERTGERRGKRNAAGWCDRHGERRS